MEKIYKAMKQAGTVNVVFGVILAVFGTLIAVGSGFLIFQGARLLKKKSEIMF